jgi:hypothetical protein
MNMIIPGQAMCIYPGLENEVVGQSILDEQDNTSQLLCDHDLTHICSTDLLQGTF